MARKAQKSPGCGIIAAPQSEAAFEGARVLDAGGNAADALVAAAFVQGVVDPHRCGIGGFGCSTLNFETELGRESIAIDFHGRAGSRARPDRWAGILESIAPDGFGYVLTGKVNDIGHEAITVPGMLAGVAEIHRRYGTLPWRDLVMRAVPYAAYGFQVQPELAEFWIRPGLYGRVSTRDRLALTSDGKRISFKESGETYKAGENFRQPDLAATYEHIADAGPDTFYRGDLGARIAKDWAANGALVTADDLARYRPEVRPALAGRFAGREIVTTPLPGGGVALLQALALAEKHRVAERQHNSADYIDVLGSILQSVWSDRLGWQGDTAFGTPDDATFLSSEYLRELDAQRAAAPPLSGAASSDTTQLSIIDGWGNAISFSHSLGYNSGVFAPGTGILFNNCMSAFDPRPGQRNSIAPGKARSTAVAETIVLDDGKPSIVLGSPGAARITAGLVEVLINRLSYGMNIAEAVVHPRFDAYGPGTIVVESRFPLAISNELESRGWNVTRSQKPFGVIGRVYAVEVHGHPPRESAAGVDPGAPGAAYRQSPERER